MPNLTSATTITTYFSFSLQGLSIDNSTATPIGTSSLTSMVATPSRSLPNPVSIFLSMIAVSLSAMAIVFNSLLILAIFKSRALQTPTNLFLSSLATGETAFAMSGMPVAAACVLAGNWPFTQTACRVSAAVQSLARSSSTFSLMAVCLDRCLAVSRPLKYSHLLTMHTGSVFLVLLWLFAIALALLPINRVWGRYSYDHAHFMCIHMADNGNENLVREVICSFLPAFVIVASLLQIIRDVRSHHRIFSVVPVPVAAPDSAGATQGGRGRRDKMGQGESIPGFVLPVGPRSFNRNTMRAMRSLYIVTLGYAIFCLPSDFVNAFQRSSQELGEADFTKNFSSRSEESKMIAVEETGEKTHPNWNTTQQNLQPRHHVTAIVWLSFLCGVVNPLVIIAFNRIFRREVMDIFSCRKLLRKMRSSRELFTIHTGLHSILEATLVLNIVKNEHASTVASTRRQVLGPAQAQ